MEYYEPDDSPWCYDRTRRLYRLSAEQNHRCAYCGKNTWYIRDYPEKWQQQSNQATVEHVVCKIDDGDWSWFNTVMACGGCNNRRGDRYTAEEFYLRITDRYQNRTLEMIAANKVKIKQIAERKRKSEIRRQAWIARGGPNVELYA